LLNPAGQIEEKTKERAKYRLIEKRW